MLGMKLSKKVDEVFSSICSGSPEEINDMSRGYHFHFFGHLMLDASLS